MAFDNTVRYGSAGSALGPVGAGVGIIAGLGMDLYNSFDASSKEKKLRKQITDVQKQPWARYSTQPAMERYGAMALEDITNPTGFSGAETGQFKQNLAQVGQGAYVNGTNAGGGSLSKAILTNNLGYQTSAINEFAAKNEAIKRQKRGAGFGRYATFAQNEQGLDNQNISREINYRMQLERALGESASHQSDVQSQTIDNIGNDLMGAGLNYFAGGSGRYGSAAQNPYQYTNSTSTDMFNSNGLIPETSSSTAFVDKKPRRRYNVFNLIKWKHRV